MGGCMPACARLRMAGSLLLLILAAQASFGGAAAQVPSLSADDGILDAIPPKLSPGSPGRLARELASSLTKHLRGNLAEGLAGSEAGSPTTSKAINNVVKLVKLVDALSADKEECQSQLAAYQGQGDSSSEGGSEVFEVVVSAKQYIINGSNISDTGALDAGELNATDAGLATTAATSKRPTKDHYEVYHGGGINTTKIGEGGWHQQELIFWKLWKVIFRVD